MDYALHSSSPGKHGDGVPALAVPLTIDRSLIPALGGFISKSSLLRLAKLVSYFPSTSIIAGVKVHIDFTSGMGIFYIQKVVYVELKLQT